MSIKLVLVERHTVLVEKTFDWSEEEIIEAFGSVDDFWEEFGDDTDEFNQFFWDSEPVSQEEDWISDRKGYTDYEWKEVDE